MRLEEFDFALPEALIAKFPLAARDESRLLRIDPGTGAREHRRFFDLPKQLERGDLLILNNTKVFPARLYAQGPADRRFEVLLLRPLEAAGELGPTVWEALLRPGKRIIGEVSLCFPGGVRGSVRREGAEGMFRVEFSQLPETGFFAWVFEAGEPPLPPYLKRTAEQSDRDNYQTVFAKTPGSVAAPTAGLHFTPSLFDQLETRGVLKAELTLHVGYGTFAPIRAERLEDHVMHSEWYSVPKETLALIEQTRAAGNRVIAVGTTTLRALESAARFGPQGQTQLFITPGFALQLVDGLITNFHLPQSSLLLLVAALLGTQPLLDAYAEAIAAGYRFYSYGDAMLILAKEKKRRPLP